MSRVFFFCVGVCVYVSIVSNSPPPKLAAELSVCFACPLCIGSRAVHFSEKHQFPQPMSEASQIMI